ncbi:MAG: YlxR family protein [Thermodesulfobacteriota bacterium]
MPERTCIGCRKVLSKEQLVRLAADVGAELVVDKRQRLGGRGVYICNERECFDRVVQKGREGLARGFRYRVEIGDREKLWSDFLDVTSKKLSC